MGAEKDGSLINNFLPRFIIKILRLFPYWKIFTFLSSITAILVKFGVSYTIADGLVYLAFMFMLLWLTYHNAGGGKDMKIFVYGFAGISILLQVLIVFLGISDTLQLMFINIYCLTSEYC